MLVSQACTQILIQYDLLLPGICTWCSRLMAVSSMAVDYLKQYSRHRFCHRILASSWSGIAPSTITICQTQTYHSTYKLVFEPSAIFKLWPWWNGAKLTMQLSGLYPYFLNHPGQIHPLSDVRVWHIHGFSHVLQLYIYTFIGINNHPKRMFFIMCPTKKEKQKSK